MMLIENIKEKKRELLIALGVAILYYYLSSIVFDGKSNLSKVLISIVFSLGLVSSIRSNMKYILSFFIALSYALTYYYSSLYGELSFGSAASIAESDISESVDFLYSIDFHFLVRSILLSAVLFILLIQFKIERNNCINYISFVILIMSSLSIGYVIYSPSNESGTPKRMVRYNLVLNPIIHFSEYYRYARLENNMDITPSWSNVQVTDVHKEVSIVVIGESAMRNRLGIYGYDIDTTPDIDKYAGVSIVSDALSPASQTMTSLPRILAINDGVTTQYDLNIVDLANIAGYETTWISNQGRFGKADTAITIIANQADNKIFLNNDYHDASSDFKLIEPLLEILKEPRGKKLIFLHTIGSHYDFCRRSKEGKYKLKDIDENKLSDCYDNSIFNTFKLINEIQSILSNKSISYQMVYFSDHGMVKVERRPYIVHGVGSKITKEAFEIPLIFWDTGAKGKEYINIEYYMRDFTHMLSLWLGIKSDQLDDTKSAISSNYNSEKFVVDDNIKKIHFD